MQPTDIVLKADRVGVTYGSGHKAVHAVHEVSLELKRGETLAIVGESGCGKSSLARALVGLTDPTSGAITFPADTGTAPDGTRIQMVFQDPFSSFNPRKRIRRSIADALALLDKSEAEKIAFRDHLLEKVGFGPEVLDRFPHEFSGGQRQRLGIVRALATGARIIVFDEPVSALDVSVQAQILNMIADMQAELGLSYVFISHDLAVVKHIADRIAIMYLGRVVEEGARASFWSDSSHPYSQILMDAVPGAEQTPEPEGGAPVVDASEVTAMAPPPGCVFHPRCALRKPVCETKVPVLRDEADDRRIACHLF
ncbi:oligopeptide/dipeptide ABC transporter ATP-binding protein [Psychromarinibacter halotolerans]|uniref:Oligopeptide/dipeptide ABC transporter ATP-binding protein n=1 Tax=Psychromarinibacter halotolerans TaxID=1775175 RepID=A0ABV7GW55_9RHOB|nr:oligopeptide/dipeptide ABC transporter ATP-binding protein [Psychromarinibacter halotolerans]MDF0597617.1 ATP-binding cassette domain-containing protein [Psychromarinibacter halotolerans]